MRLIPLIVTVRKLDDKMHMSFEYLGELPVNEGEVVTLRARVHEVKRSGGYPRDAEVQPVTTRQSFSLDTAELFLVDDEPQVSARRTRPK